MMRNVTLETSILQERGARVRSGVYTSVCLILSRLLSFHPEGA
jgi:hypothetical protein